LGDEAHPEEGTHEVTTHWSALLQLEEMSAWAHPVAGTHVSEVQAFPSLQLTAE
jgi:hypothetical protein